MSLLVMPQLAAARVNVTINGTSNGEVLYAFKGPVGIDNKITVSRSAGSISSAKARAVFHTYTVNIGNEVISAGTEGDDEYTHVRAGSLFFGKAKFVAAKKGATVNNFKITYHVDGDLGCYIPDLDFGEGYAEAFVESQIRFNDSNKFAGTELVDGATGDQGGTGDFAGMFSGSTYEVGIDHNFKVNLGKLKDGKVYPMLFFGATYVSYGADVPIEYCYSDFLNTSKFSVDADIADSKGQFKITPAKQVDSLIDPQPWDSATYPDLTIYIEDENETFLNNIDVNQIQLFERLGDAGSIQPKSIEDVGDFDQDGVADRGVVFEGVALFDLLQIEVLGFKNDTTLYLIGETESGTPFVSAIPFESTPL